MGLQRIDPILRRLTFTKTHVIRDYHSVVFGELWYEITIQISPGRLTVQAKHDLSIWNPFIYVVLLET